MRLVAVWPEMKRGNSETEELQIPTQNARLVFAWTFGVLFNEDGLRVSYDTCTCAVESLSNGED